MNAEPATLVASVNAEPAALVASLKADPAPPVASVKTEPAPLVASVNIDPAPLVASVKTEPAPAVIESKMLPTAEGWVRQVAQGNGKKRLTILAFAYLRDLGGRGDECGRCAGYESEGEDRRDERDSREHAEDGGYTRNVGMSNKTSKQDGDETEGRALLIGSGPWSISVDSIGGAAERWVGGSARRTPCTADVIPRLCRPPQSGNPRTRDGRFHVFTRVFGLATGLSIAMPRAIISPSVLASDFGQLTAECKRMVKGGAEWLHMGMSYVILRDPDYCNS